MIDLHAHILPALDDGARDLAEALAMARLAVADGIRTLVATPHLFWQDSHSARKINEKAIVLEQLHIFRDQLAAADIPLEILPGCDFPLHQEALRLLEEDRALTINDGRRYLLLELSNFAIPPFLAEICFRLQGQGITPIITHPERNPLIQEKPERLVQLLDLGCLAQLTASSLTGGFGRRVARFARELVRRGYVQVVASDAHGVRHRPPLLQPAVAELRALVGTAKAEQMVLGWPERIIRGELVDL